MNITFIKWLSQPAQFDYVNASGITAKEKERRKRELQHRFSQSQFADFAAPEVEDNGNPESIYSADELAKIKEEIAFSEIRRATIKADIEPELRRYIQRRNDATLKSKKIITQRFSFRQHGTKTNQ